MTVKGDQGQWCECMTEASRKGARKTQRRGAGHVWGHHFAAAMKYERWDTQAQQWRPEDGAVPLVSQEPVRIWAAMTRRWCHEDDEGDSKQTAFTSKQRKAVTQAMNSIHHTTDHKHTDEEEDDRQLEMAAIWARRCAKCTHHLG